MMLYTESIADQTDHFADGFVCKTMMLWWHYDAWKFTADTILFSEIQSKKRDILMF